MVWFGVTSERGTLGRIRPQPRSLPLVVKVLSLAFKTGWMEISLNVFGFPVTAVLYSINVQIKICV